MAGKMPCSLVRRMIGPQIDILFKIFFASFTLVMMVLAVLLILARPWIESGWYGLRLSWMPAPGSLDMQSN